MAKTTQSIKPDRPSKRAKPTKNAAKIFLKRSRPVAQVNEKMDRNSKMDAGIRDIHGINVEEWRAAGGTVE